MLKHKKNFIVIFVFILAFTLFYSTSVWAAGKYFCAENVIVGGQIRGGSVFDSTPSGIDLNTCLNLCQSNNAEACNYGWGGNNADRYCESEHSGPDGDGLYVYIYPGVNPSPYNGTQFAGWSYAWPQDSPCSAVQPPPGEPPSGESVSIPPAQPFPAQPVFAPPTQGLPTNLGQLIQQIFSWSLLVLGIAVFVSFFYAGFIYLTAAGNTGRVGEAQSRMTNAVFGAVLLLSSYLILYTINPDFVKSTFNLPGLGKSSSGTTPPSGVVPPPADALTRHPDQSSQVASIKTQLESQSIDLTGDCGAFEITKRVAWLLGSSGAGLLSKPSGANCQGYAVAIIAYSDGYIYDILSDAGNTNRPQWIPDACGPIGGDGTCSDRYSPAITP
ncbi:MAG: hypothetical protein HYT64_02490 [Candidatus Yanofskybacteria bacterium]|nr:hypothetical protein [Candidatus Yanofskybacteria bacterium]